MSGLKGILSLTSDIDRREDDNVRYCVKHVKKTDRGCYQDIESVHE